MIYSEKFSLRTVDHGVSWRDGILLLTYNGAAAHLKMLRAQRVWLCLVAVSDTLYALSH